MQNDECRTQSGTQLPEFHSAFCVHHSAFARWHIAALIGILILATAIRLHQLGQQGLWYDELESVEAAVGRCTQHDVLPRDQLLHNAPILTSLKTALPISEGIGNIVRRDHPPLYFFSLRLWMDLFGQSDFIIRLLSVFFSVASIFILFDAARLGHGAKVALAACLIMALATPQIRYAQEARQYTMCTMLELISAAMLIRMERFGITRLRLAILCGALLAMMLTHYFCLAICLALGIYSLVAFKGRARWRVMEAFCAAGIIYVLVWGPFFLIQRPQFVHAEYYWANDLTPGHYARIALYSAIAPLRLIVEPRSSDEKFAMLSAAIFVLPFFMLRRNPRMLLWGLLILMPIVLLDILDVARGELNVREGRYFLVAGPGVYVVISAVLSGTRIVWMRWALPTLAVLGAAISVPIGYFDKMDPAPVAAYLDQHMRDDEPVVFAGGSWGPYYTGLTYLGVGRYSHKFPRPIALLDTPATPELIRELRKYPKVWFICAGPQPANWYLPGAVDVELERHFFMLCWLHAVQWPAETSAQAPAQGRK